MKNEARERIKGRIKRDSLTSTEGNIGLMRRNRER